jgi:hypothetical protein
VLGVLLALGDNGPFGMLLAPLVRHFRAPVKLLFLTNLALALLAARGLDRARRDTLRPAWLALATGSLLVALALAVRVRPELPGQLLGRGDPRRSCSRARPPWSRAPGPRVSRRPGGLLLGAALAAHSRTLAPLAGLLSRVSTC